MSRRLLFITLVFVLFLILISLSYKLLYISPLRILTVNQLSLETNYDSIYEKDIKISGKIDGKSLEWNQSKNETDFYILSEDNNNRLHVLYKGGGLNNIRNGSKVVIEGQYTVERLFIANKLIFLD